MGIFLKWLQSVGYDGRPKMWNFFFFGKRIYLFICFISNDFVWSFSLWETIDTGGGPYLTTYLPTYQVRLFVAKYLLNNQNKI